MLRKPIYFRGVFYSQFHVAMHIRSNYFIIEVAKLYQVNRFMSRVYTAYEIKMVYSNNVFLIQQALNASFHTEFYFARHCPNYMLIHQYGKISFKK